jgi:hypothetical protein
MKSSKYSIESASLNRDRLIEALQSEHGFVPVKKERDWYALIEKLPIQLRNALLREILAGNSVQSIQYADWPQIGSVVVCLDSIFKNNFKNSQEKVAYRLVNDSHYWREEISLSVNGIEHLIIT